MRAILRNNVLQNTSSGPLLGAIEVVAMVHHHLVLEPLLVRIRHLLFVNLRVVNEAHWTRV